MLDELMMKETTYVTSSLKNGKKCQKLYKDINFKPNQLLLDLSGGAAEKSIKPLIEI